MEELIRQAAVAGSFYPADGNELNLMLKQFLAQAEQQQPRLAYAPKAIIAPHAGYIYSGPVAASAYYSLYVASDSINRVVLLGPSHRVPFRGLASCSASHYATPLGLIPLDRPALENIERLPQVSVNDAAHIPEHSLEVQLPFLQYILDDFVLTPLVVGDANENEVAEVLEMLWGDRHTLIVISSDLSHYHDYATAQRLDQQTSRAIETLNPAEIQYEDACGRNPVNGLLHVAKRRAMHVETVDLRNSGDTAGPRDQVVGYGAYLFFEHQA
ncbi:COG1355, Predicted dioxygenase [hydrothermal vent metagenome]|uniref:COG1355, Predicted dioxygenase n=1 Tax=hydrothermal vent metagenome TaxID=652676 RepID=A0A3B1B3D9_9ZZZZ